jgi:hypothetical protein
MKSMMLKTDEKEKRKNAQRKSSAIDSQENEEKRDNIRQRGKK